jgi:hypothetical protein
MGEEIGAPDEPKAKPFFAIEEEPKEVQPQQPPLSGAVMGQVSPQSTPVSATQFVAPQSSLGTPQLSGQVNTFTHGGQQFTQLQPQKVGFRWPQFLLGIVIPWIVIFGASFLSAILQDDYDEWYDFSRSESYSIVPDDDGWFVQSVSINDGESFAYGGGCCLENNTTSARVWINSGVGYTGEVEGLVIVEEYQNETSSRYEEQVIGEYTGANQTLWFKSSQFSAEQISLDVNFYDYDAEEEYWQNVDQNQDIGEMVFCFLPFAYVVGLVVAFARGNSALGIGLLCAIPASILFLPLLFVLALLAFGF